MQIPGVSPLELSLAILILSTGALLQASVGFGMALMSVPLLAWVNPVFIPGPVLMCGLVLSSLMLREGWKELERENLKASLSGLIFGTMAGSLGLSLATGRNLGPLFAVLILLAVALSLLGLDLKLTRKNLRSAGLVSGIMGVMVGINGPPIALLYQRQSGATVRTNLAVFFVLADIIALAALAWIGLFGLRELLLGFLLLPGVLVAWLLSSKTTQLVEQGAWLRTCVLLIASLSAVGLFF